MMPLLFFISVVILVYLGMQYYVAFWILRNFPSLPVDPSAIRITVLLIAVLFPFAMYLLQARPGLFSEWFAYITYLWVGVSFILLTWALVGDCVILICRLLGVADKVRQPTAYAVLAVVATLSLLAFWNASRLPRVKTLEVRLPHLPRSLDGFSIVQVSDLHLGVTVSPAKFRKIAGQINALQPDLIALTGDLIDPGIRDEAEIRKIGATLTARVGKIAVLGNHDFYHGVEDAVECYRSCGAVVLRNGVMELPNGTIRVAPSASGQPVGLDDPAGLQVAGVDDIVTAGMTREEVSAVLSKLNPKKPSLYLSHQPRMVDLAAQHGIGLMLSGHTHRGQIFPFGFFVWLSARHFYGLYHERGTTLYVTSGTGQWGPPMRLFTDAEIVRIILRSPEAPAGVRQGKTPP